ncbi:MAG: calcium-binding protein [Cyanobacteria bacterium J06632_22]
MGIRTLDGNNSSNNLQATKTKIRLWWDRWDSWEIRGFGGDDYIVGGEKSDKLYGGDGGDTIHGLDGNDTIWGDRSGESGVDFLYGGDGNDKLYGGNGDDELYGGKNNDVLYGGRGADLLVGGSGSDTYYSYNFDGVSFQDTIVEEAVGGYDTLYTNVDVALPDNVEKLVVFGGTGSTGIGNDLHNTMDGWLFDDTLHGKGGTDFLDGGLGNDHLDGGDSTDFLYGGQGSDTLVGGDGHDFLTGYDKGVNERDVMTGGKHADTFYLAHGAGYTNISYMDGGFATITDFSSAEGDKVVLAGSMGIYTREFKGGDTHLLRSGNLIAIIENTNASTFSMVDDVTYYS